jgi:hypothetical protein
MVTLGIEPEKGHPSGYLGMFIFSVGVAYLFLDPPDTAPTSP